MFPDDQTLIARGKQTTLLKERREQIERVQNVCKFVQGQVALMLQGVQKRPPEDVTQQVQESNKALENAFKAQVKIIELSAEIDSLEAEAWGKK